MSIPSPNVVSWPRRLFGHTKYVGIAVPHRRPVRRYVSPKYRPSEKSLLPSARVSAVTLTVVHDEAEAEVVCGFLRANNIECFHRKTNVAAGAYTNVLGRGGPIEVVVDEHDEQAARQLLPSR